MKRLLLLLCAYVLSATGWSQTLTVHNATPFPILYRAVASDPGTCAMQYYTGTMMVPPGGTYVVTAADFSPTPPGPFLFEYIRYYDQSFFTCPSGAPAGPCRYGLNHLGDPSSGIAPSNSCMVGAVCGPGAGQITNGACGFSSPIDFIAKFFP